MAKFPKFMVCQNPMAEPGQDYILHTQFPKFLARMSSEGAEVLIEFDSDPEKQEKVINRLFDWYKAYKIHERQKR